MSFQLLEHQSLPQGRAFIHSVPLAWKVLTPKPERSLLGEAVSDHQYLTSSLTSPGPFWHLSLLASNAYVIYTFTLLVSPPY